MMATGPCTFSGPIAIKSYLRSSKRILTPVSTALSDNHLATVDDVDTLLKALYIIVHLLATECVYALNGGVSGWFQILDRGTLILQVVITVLTQGYDLMICTKHRISIFGQSLTPYGRLCLFFVEQIAEFTGGSLLASVFAIVGIGHCTQIGHLEVTESIAVDNLSAGCLTCEAAELDMSGAQIDFSHYIDIADGGTVQLTAYSAQTASVAVGIDNGGIDQTEVGDQSPKRPPSCLSSMTIFRFLIS